MRRLMRVLAGAVVLTVIVAASPASGAQALRVVTFCASPVFSASEVVGSGPEVASIIQAAQIACETGFTVYVRRIAPLVPVP